jgi:microcystin-dependent protein
MNDVEALRGEVAALRDEIERRTQAPWLVGTVVGADTTLQTVDVEMPDGTIARGLPAMGTYIPEVGHSIMMLMSGHQPVVLPPAAPLTSAAPAQVTAVTVTPAITALMVSWAGLADVDVKWNRGYYTVQVATDAGFTAIVLSQDVAATSCVATGLVTGTTYYVRVRAVDYVGTVGTWSTTANGVPAAVTVPDLAGIDLGVPSVGSLAGITPTSFDPASNLVFLTTDRKLYRWDGASAWTVAVPTADLTGTITTAQIAADAVTANEIAAGAVGTTEIAALAVTSAQVAASAITTTKIAADAVTAGEIAAGAVGSSELAAGAVIAGKITAGTIVAADIAAGTITGAKLAATTITASNIAADTITASQIAAGTITGAKIAAGAITTEKLTVAALSDNAVPNGSFEEASAADATRAALWDYDFGLSVFAHPTYSLSTVEKDSGAQSVKAAFGGTQNSALASQAIPVTPGDVWYVSDSVKASSALGAGHYLRAFYFSGAPFNYNSGTRVSETMVVSNGPFTTSWVQSSGLVTIPANARYMVVTSWAWNLGAVDVYHDSVIARRATVSATIADGAITASKVAANTITANEIAASAITSSELAANAVIAGKITAGTIVSADIAAGTITGDRLVAGTITASQIAASTITGGNIAADTIASGNIAASAITSSELAANAVIAGKIAAGTIVAADIAANAITAGKLSAIAIEAGKYIRSTTYTPGSAGWTIEADGFAEFNNVTVRGDLEAGRVVNSSTNLLATKNPGGETSPSAAELVPNGTFDTNITGWTGSNCTLARVTSPTPQSGAGAMSLTATGAGTMTATTATGTSGFVVTPGTSYSVSAYFRTAVTARTCSLSVSLYDSVGTLLCSPASIQAVTDSSSGWVQFATQLTAYHPLAAFAAVSVSVWSAAASEVHYVDTVSVKEAVPYWGSDPGVIATVGAAMPTTLSRTTSSPIAGSASVQAVASSLAYFTTPSPATTAPFAVGDVEQGYEWTVTLKTTSGTALVFLGVVWRSDSATTVPVGYEVAQTPVLVTTTAKTFRFATCPAATSLSGTPTWGAFGIGITTPSATVLMDTSSIVKATTMLGSYGSVDFLQSRTDVTDMTGLLMPAGALIPWAGNLSAVGDIYGASGSGWSGYAAVAGCPAGFLPCDGRAVSRATYWRLFAAIGTTYGVGDGSTTFNVPDMRGRVVVALDNMGGTDAGRLSAANTLGGTGGHEKLQSHSHTVTANGTLSGNQGTPHQMWTDSAGGGGGTAATNPTIGGISGVANPWYADNTGAGNAENMQPYILMNYLIKC